MANIIENRLTRANGLPVMPILTRYLNKNKKGKWFINFDKITRPPKFKTRKFHLATGQVKCYKNRNEELKAQKCLS